MPKLFDLDGGGYVGTYDVNELEHVSTIADPVKYRVAIDEDQVESNLGGLSANLRRPDGRHEEYALAMGRLTADKQAGAFYIAVRQRGTQEVREVAYFDNDVIVFRAPIQAPNFPAQNDPHSFLRSPNAQFDLEMQDDGNVVIYDEVTPGRPVLFSFFAVRDQVAALTAEVARLRAEVDELRQPAGAAEPPA